MAVSPGRRTAPTGSSRQLNSAGRFRPEIGRSLQPFRLTFSSWLTVQKRARYPNVTWGCLRLVPIQTDINLDLASRPAHIISVLGLRSPRLMNAVQGFAFALFAYFGLFGKGSGGATEGAGADGGNGGSADESSPDEDTSFCHRIDRLQAEQLLAAQVANGPYLVRFKEQAQGGQGVSYAVSLRVAPSVQGIQHSRIDFGPLGDVTIEGQSVPTLGGGVRCTLSRAVQYLLGEWKSQGLQVGEMVLPEPELAAPDPSAEDEARSAS